MFGSSCISFHMFLIDARPGFDVTNSIIYNKINLHYS